MVRRGDLSSHSSDTIIRCNMVTSALVLLLLVHFATAENNFKIKVDDDNGYSIMMGGMCINVLKMIHDLAVTIIITQINNGYRVVQ